LFPFLFSMKFSAQTRLAILFMSTLVIGACTANTSARGNVESYLAQEINELSPRTATQGEFRIRSVEWVNDTTVRVTYVDDADVVLHGIATVDPNGEDLVTNFRIDNGMQSSSFSSTSSPNSSTDSSESATSSASSGMSSIY